MHYRLLLLTANLGNMPGFALMNGVAIGPNGAADPLTQLFRSTAVGVEVGPFISQVGAEECGEPLYATRFSSAVPAGFHSKEEEFSRRRDISVCGTAVGWTPKKNKHTRVLGD